MRIILILLPFIWSLLCCFLSKLIWNLRTSDTSPVSSLVRLNLFCWEVLESLIKAREPGDKPAETQGEHANSVEKVLIEVSFRKIVSFTEKYPVISAGVKISLTFIPTATAGNVRIAPFSPDHVNPSSLLVLLQRASETPVCRCTTCYVSP